LRREGRKRKLTSASSLGKEGKEKGTYPCLLPWEGRKGKGNLPLPPLLGREERKKVPLFLREACPENSVGLG